MLPFWKKKPGALQVPEWASSMNQNEFKAFKKTIEVYFSKREIPVEWGDGTISVPENIMGVGQLGLVNLAQICGQTGTKFYRKIVEDHFESMIRAHAFETELEELVKDFESIKQYIGVRLYDVEYIAVIGKEFTVGKDIGDDIYAMLVFDLPHSVENIKPEQILSWNKTEEELFALGMENIKKNYPLTLTEEDLGGIKSWVVQSDHFYAANVIFSLNDWAHLIGKEGVLIGLPHRHATLIYPINNLDVIKAINILIPLIHYMNQKGPGSLSNNLYWVKDDVFIPLPYTLTDEKLEFIPPDEFVKVINSLASAHH